MRLAQSEIDGARVVLATDDGESWIVPNAARVIDLARGAIAEATTLADVVARRGRGASVDLAALAAAGKMLPPIDHDDPAHLLLTGTGLTHLGSADARDAMHTAAHSSDTLTDSMRMFRSGLEGGKPAPDTIGVQSEWFYKGDGGSLVAPGAPLPWPDYAEDAGEEPEIAGVYLIGDDGTPYRLGFALANEFSDHLTEQQNYLLLAHSKLRAAAIGPELLLGALPGDLRGASRIHRDGAVLWERPFLSGEANMSHTIANLEYHHFKYAGFRRPGDVHVHFFGTATLSFADGVQTRDGDIFEIEMPEFGLPLVNAVARIGAQPTPLRVL